MGTFLSLLYPPLYDNIKTLLAWFLIKCISKKSHDQNMHIVIVKRKRIRYKQGLLITLMM